MTIDGRRYLSPSEADALLRAIAQGERDDRELAAICIVIDPASAAETLRTLRRASTCRAAYHAYDRYRGVVKQTG
jgi:hypothetical protein